MPNEFTLKDEVHDRLKVCRGRGLRVWFLKTHGHPMQRVGVPDYLVCFEGRFKAIELKRIGENPTPLQAIEMRAILASGGYAGVAYSWEEFCDVCSFPAWCKAVPRR